MGMFASNNALAFDLDALSELVTLSKEIQSDLQKQRNNLKQGLEQLRKDWQTPAGAFFFSQLDTNWESDIIKFEDTLKQFQIILEDAYKQFKKVENKANSIVYN